MVWSTTTLPQKSHLFLPLLPHYSISAIPITLVFPLHGGLWTLILFFSLNLAQLYSLPLQFPILPLRQITFLVVQLVLLERNNTIMHFGIITAPHNVASEGSFWTTPWVYYSWLKPNQTLDMWLVRPFITLLHYSAFQYSVVSFLPGHSPWQDSHSFLIPIHSFLKVIGFALILSETTLPQGYPLHSDWQDQ